MNDQTKHFIDQVKKKKELEKIWKSNVIDSNEYLKRHQDQKRNRKNEKHESNN